MSGLAKSGEQGWPLGSFQSGPEESIPQGAVARLYDGFWDDMGYPNRRGGSVYKSSSALSPAPRWIADRRLAGGQRTAFANSSLLSSLAADDTSFSTVYSTSAPQVAVAPVVVRGALFWAVDNSGADQVVGWAGSRKPYYDGTASLVSTTRGSKTVTELGAGGFSANVDAGMFFHNIATGTTEEGWGIVETVTDNTHLQLTEAWPYKGGSRSYELYPTRVAWTGTAGQRVSALGSVANRLLVGRGTQITFSPIESPFSTWVDDDSHTMPSTVLGIANVRDTAVVFTTEGTFAIFNMALDLTDSLGNPQQRVERINDELILWGQHGLTNWRGAVIAPMLDGVWLMDTAGAPTKISGSIEDTYLSYVQAGYVPGTATVYQGRYFLPILNSSGTPQDLLTCRLTPNAAGRAMLWAQHRGHGGSGNVRGVAYRAPTSAGGTPLLLAAGSDGYISTLRHFEPGSSYKSDADGVAHKLEIQTRAYPTGNDVPNQVRFLKAHYTLTDAASDNPTMDLAYAVDGATSFTSATGSASETSGSIGEYTWRVEKQARLIQFRIRSSGAAATAKIRSVELQIWPSGRV